MVVVVVVLAVGMVPLTVDMVVVVELLSMYINKVKEGMVIMAMVEDC